MEIDRTFRDINGIEWHVSHVPAAADAPPTDHGCLSFESGHMERHLAPFPANWQALTMQRLEQMCRVATAVEREIALASRREQMATDVAPEPIVDVTPAEGSEVVVPVTPLVSDHVSVLANAYPVRESRFTFRG